MKSAPRKTSLAKTRNAKLAQADSVLQGHANEIRALTKRTVDSIIEIGRRLVDAKKRVPHGEWLAWLEREFGWSADTAANFMHVYKFSRHARFRRIRNMAKITPTLLYALARAPGEVVDHTVERLARGETVTPQEVKNKTRYVTVVRVTPKPRSYSIHVNPKPAEPRWPAPAVQRWHAPPDVTDAPEQDDVRTDAAALIDALEGASAEVLDAAVQLLHGERQDAVAAVAQALAALSAKLRPGSISPLMRG